MPNTTRSYDILIGGVFYKTITTTGGYNFSQITQDLHGLAKVGQLSGFDLSKGVKVVNSTHRHVEKDDNEKGD